ncbi:MAG: putative bifunctional diguanylate cyclase/phosphodiesterase [Actinomycetes bacterium]
MASIEPSHPNGTPEADPAPVRLRARMVAGESMLADPMQFVRAMVASPDGFSVWDAVRSASGEIIDFEARFLNDAACAMLGRAPADIVGRWCRDAFPASAEYLVNRWADAVERAGQFHEEIQVADLGDRRWVHQQVLSIGDGVVVISQDVTERRIAQAALERMALHDPLTGLPNRALAIERITWALAQSRRDGGVTAVMFVDLDHFKRINDSLGHATGDLLLGEVAARLRASVPADAVVARLGGDEFVVCAHLATAEAAMAVAERMRSALEPPVVRRGREIAITCSIGVACSGRTNDAEGLIRDADRATYEAKRQGRDRVHLFDRAMRDRIQDELTIESEFRHAITRDELVLFHHPVIDTRTGRASQVEALVRWEHPTRGLLTPTAFIDVAEESGLVVPLGSWVIEHAASQLAHWDANEIGIERIWINMSASELRVPGYARRAADILAAHGLTTDRIGIELTERVLLDEALEAGGEFTALAELGFRIAIDDFGVGYSSLRYLHVHPVHTLKLDDAFVRTIDRGPRETAVPNAVIRLGHGLGYQVTAECVETAGQARRLIELGCDHLSGYLFAEPVRPEVIASAMERAEAVFARV